MTSKSNSDAALGDVRATSYNAATANPNGYTGTIDDAIAQIRAEPDEVRAYQPLNISRERYELLGFLGVLKPAYEMSGRQAPRSDGVQRVPRLTPDPAAIDHVEYGVPAAHRERAFYSLEYARKAWPQNFAAPPKGPDHE